MKINKYIKELLYTHDCVIIPNLGGFILKFAEAEVQSGATSDVINPPKKNLVFESNLVIDDGILASFLVDTGRIDAEEAQQLIASFVSDVNFTLASGGEVYFDEVGYLRKNEQGALVFDVEKDSNFYGDAFALNPVETTPIAAEPETKPKKSKKTLFIVLGICLLLVIASIYPIKYFFFDKKKVHTPIANNKIEKIDTVITDKAKPDDKEEIISETKEEIKETKEDTKKEIIETKPIQPGEFYLIANSFRQDQNAQKFVNKLKEMGYTGEILSDEGGKIRVSVGSFKTASEAKAEQKKIRAQGKLDVWLLIK